MTNTTPLTDDELAAMRARVDAATVINNPVVADSPEGWQVLCHYGAAAQRMDESDAALFAHARRDIQTLLDEVARLREENANLHRVIQASLPIVDLDALE